MEEKEEEEQIVAALLYKRRKREAAPFLILPSALLNYTEAVTPRVFLSRFIFEAGGKNPAAGSGIGKNFQFLLLLSPPHILD